MAYYFWCNLPPNPRSNNSSNSQINPGTQDESWNSKIQTIKILLDSGASASIVRKNLSYERNRILKDTKNKWITMAGTFNTTFVKEIILKLSSEIYTKCYLTNKL